MLNTNMLSVVISTSLALSALTLSAQSPEGREPRNSHEHRQVAEAYARGGVPAAAAVFGKYRSSENFGGIDVAENITGLTWASHLVIVGAVRSGQPVLSQDQRHVLTEYRVHVMQTIKGSEAVAPGREVIVTVPGGRMVFANGTSAEVLLSTGAPPLRPGGQYLLFLELIEDPELAAEVGRLGTFRPTGGRQGVHELVGTPPTRVVPYIKDLPVSKELLGARDVKAALEFVHSAALASPSFAGERRLTPPPQ